MIEPRPQNPSIDQKKRNHELAIKANVYARSRILKGITQFENNSLSAAHIRALDKAVYQDCRPLYDNPDHKDFLQLDASKYIYNFAQTIAITSKYSLGNCTELAYQALNYFLTETKDQSINVESYCLLGKDDTVFAHQFVVIGRRHNSNPYKPEEWGDEAFICDPWAHENQVYPAKNYLTHLKTYVPEYIPYQTEPENLLDAPSELHIKLINFNPSLHKLVPISFTNIHYLRENMSTQILKDNYTAKVNAIVSALEAYEKKLTALRKELIKKDRQDSKHISLTFKAMLIPPLIQKIKCAAIFANAAKEPEDYQKVRSRLMFSLNGILAKALSILELTATEKRNIEMIDASTSISLFGFFMQSHKIKLAVESATTIAKKEIGIRL